VVWWLQCCPKVGVSRVQCKKPMRAKKINLINLNFLFVISRFLRCYLMQCRYELEGFACHISNLGFILLRHIYEKEVP
jgi:hypothetical protein